MRRLRPDLLMAASVPVLLVAGVLPWQRDVMCTRAGCGSVLAGAWAGSLVWAVVLLAGLALAGGWVLLLPVRGRVPSAVAALTALVAVLAAAAVVVSADALVFGRTGLISFRLPVTETFPVLAVHPAEGLVLGLVGFLLQAVAGWTTLRHRALVTPLRPPARRDPPPFAPAQQHAFAPAQQHAFAPAQQHAFAPAPQHAFAPAPQQAFAPGPTHAFAAGPPQAFASAAPQASAPAQPPGPPPGPPHGVAGVPGVVRYPPEAPPTGFPGAARYGPEPTGVDPGRSRRHRRD